MAQPARNPNNLPTKICPICNRAFTWRKKWERDWDNVRYCSDRCRQQAPAAKNDSPVPLPVVPTSAKKSPKPR